MLLKSCKTSLFQHFLGMIVYRGDDAKTLKKASDRPRSKSSSQTMNLKDKTLDSIRIGFWNSAKEKSSQTFIKKNKVSLLVTR